MGRFEEVTKEFRDEMMLKIRNYSNAELLEETIDLGGGDYYDGEFTDKGRWKFEQLNKELKNRLKDWLKVGL